MHTIVLAAASVVMVPTDQPAKPNAEALARTTCSETASSLWGRKLCAPVVLVDLVTGEYRTSLPAPAPLPPLRANTAFDWNGEKWVMVLEPLPTDSASAAALILHEAWHAHQEALGFPANNAVAGKLEEGSARYLLRLEWEALASALRSGSTAQSNHVAQALAFRAQRHAAFPELIQQEKEQMRHEGLAAYTGVALSSDPLRLALQEIKTGAARSSLARSFAYVSGPAWGLLLDRMHLDWRERIRSGGDLPDLSPVEAAIVTRPDDYGGTDILAEEMSRHHERQAKLAAELSATDEDRALRLPLAQMNMDFDPNRVSAAPDGSSIYHRITLDDRWGRISIEGLPLRIASDFSAAFSPWPLPDGVLDLAEGWRVEEGPQGGARLISE